MGMNNMNGMNGMNNMGGMNGQNGALALNNANQVAMPARGVKTA